eukprot:30626-Pelagococcus_subviridis.AAC.8
MLLHLHLYVPHDAPAVPSRVAPDGAAPPFLFRLALGDGRRRRRRRRRAGAGGLDDVFAPRRSAPAAAAAVGVARVQGRERVTSRHLRRDARGDRGLQRFVQELRPARRRRRPAAVRRRRRRRRRRRVRPLPTLPLHPLAVPTPAASSLDVQNEAHPSPHRRAHRPRPADERRAAQEEPRRQPDHEKRRRDRRVRPARGLEDVVVPQPARFRPSAAAFGGVLAPLRGGLVMRGRSHERRLRDDAFFARAVRAPRDHLEAMRRGDLRARKHVVRLVRGDDTVRVPIRVVPGLDFDDVEMRRRGPEARGGSPADRDGGRVHGGRLQISRLARDRAEAEDLPLQRADELPAVQRARYPQVLPERFRVVRDERGEVERRHRVVPEGVRVPRERQPVPHPSLHVVRHEKRVRRVREVIHELVFAYAVAAVGAVDLLRRRPHRVADLALGVEVVAADAADRVRELRALDLPVVVLV